MRMSRTPSARNAQDRMKRPDTIKFGFVCGILTLVGVCLGWHAPVVADDPPPTPTPTPQVSSLVSIDRGRLLNALRPQAEELKRRMLTGAAFVKPSSCSLGSPVNRQVSYGIDWGGFQKTVTETLLAPGSIPCIRTQTTTVKADWPPIQTRTFYQTPPRPRPTLTPSAGPTPAVPR